MRHSSSDKRVNALTTVRTDKKSGKVVATLKSVMAKNGKTYTVAVKSKTPKGVPVYNTLVFERP